MDWLTFDRYAAELAAETERLTTAVGRQPAERTAPSCPEWTVRELVTHVGTGHRYAADIVESGADGPRPLTRVEAPAAPADWGSWLAEGAAWLTTDAGRGWHVVRTPGGPAWHDGEAPADAELAAPARELLLILNRRLPPGEVTGNAAIFNRWLEDSRF